MIDSFSMKSGGLKFPFNWEERRPSIVDQVLFIPQYYHQHEEWTFPGWESSALFGNHEPLRIEYCAGNGEWILHKAVENPHINWIAVEKKIERVGKIWAKSQRLQLPNLRLVCGEALTFTRYYLSDNSIDEIYINFPDPWPKERHAKHRLIQPPFVEQLSRVVKRGGRSILVTDHEGYCQQICEEMQKDKSWRSLFPPPFFTTEWTNYGSSYFDSLWRHKGYTIHYMQFENNK